MYAYIARRLLLAIPTLLAISLVTFWMGYLSPSDPISIRLGEKADPEIVARVKHEYGLDLSPWQQYFNFIKNAASGSFGQSLVFTGQTVGQQIREGLPKSGIIAVFAIIVTTMVAIPAGILTALFRDTWIDRLTMFLVVLGISVPNFVMAFLFMYVIAFKMKLVPVAGWGQWTNAVLPIAILGIRPAAFVTRLTRSSMLDVLGQDYIRTARAKGLAERVVIFIHALRNALIPVVTTLGTIFGGLITGSFFIEQIFAVPGIGRMSVTAIYLRDYPAIQAITLLVATIFVLMNLLVDITYSLIDPRIKYS